MKSVAILIPTIKPGGAEKQATLLATLLDKYYRVDMYLFLGYLAPNPQNIELLRASNVHIHPLEGSLFKKIKTMAASLKENNTEVLFNYLTNCDVMGCIAGNIAGVKRIYGGIRNAHISYYKVIAERIVHNHFTAGTIFNCYSGKREIGSRGLKESKSIVIPNCFPNISVDTTRQDKYIKSIVTVGRFVKQKDYNTAIKAVGILKQTRNDFVFDVIGYGVEEDIIRQWIKEEGVEDNVVLHIRPDNVQDIVKDSDIYLSTSLYEGTSNSIMEALNWSLPVVATNVGDNNHLVIDGVNGFLHPVGDAKGIAMSLSKLLDSVELRNEMGLKSNRNLRDNYSMEIFERRYLQVIEG